MTNGQNEMFTFNAQELQHPVRVVKFSAHEKLSSPFEVNLTLASDQEISYDGGIDKEGLLTILGNTEDRYFQGVISQFTSKGVSGRFFLYEAKLVPRFWLLSMHHDCRIFQEKTVEEVITQVLQDRHIDSDQFEFRLTNTYDPKTYCVQYRESDFSFISRLLEENGIFYFFEHTPDGHKIVFGDSTANYQEIPGAPQLQFNAESSMVPDEETVHDFKLTHSIMPGKATLRDYNFERPSLNMQVDQQGDTFQDLEIYDYPGEYLLPEDGSRLAGNRLEANAANICLAHGLSDCVRLIPGYTFSLAGHDIQQFNQTFLLREVHHTGVQPQVLEEHETSDEGMFYSNEFAGIFASVLFRPGIRTPKPCVEGVQTAMVVGQAGDEAYTDDSPYGMVKVQFHWDREGNNDENSSCWLRVTYPYAGERHGVQFTPLVGDEVLVVFLEGDPDRPVVLGGLFKGSHQALLDPQSMVQNIILTPYQHRLLFNDKGAAITMNTGGGQTLQCADGSSDSANGNNARLSTSDGHSVHLAGGTSLTGIDIRTQGGNFIRLDDPGSKIEIDSPGLVRLHQGSNNQNMDGSATHIWRGDNHISITDASIHLYNDGYHVLVDSSQVKLYSGGNAVRLGPDKISITHDSEVKLTVGGSSVKLTPSTVEVNAPTVKITGGVTEIRGTPVKVNC
ncbi:MAG: type VI secretion system tip protein VgrG [Desulfobacterales bacterium]|nr:type VI secretion system tip protein VgrG [Desulfobacterales bacterium]